MGELVSVYLDALREAMSICATYPRCVILGQSVVAGGTAMRGTLEHVDQSKLLELPVFEETQLGMSIGLSLQGHFPVVSIYPRINFLLLAMGQLVLHLDAIPRYSDFRPKVIIRTAVATAEPLNPGAQHLGDYSHELRSMLQKVLVIQLLDHKDIVPAYKMALNTEHSTILVEYADLYHD